MKEAKGKAAQGRLESFFGPAVVKKSSTGSAAPKAPTTPGNGKKRAAVGTPPSSGSKRGKPSPSK
jgi:hypothetical protein